MMVNDVRTMGTRSLRLGLALTIAASALIGLARPATAAIAFSNTERIEGTDAVTIAVAVSKRLFAEDAAGTVIITRKDTFPDALSASALAAVFKGPILFTDKDRLDTPTRTELQRVLTTDKKVFIMGGTNAAISQTVQDEIEALGYTTDRIAGKTRIETAALAAGRVLQEIDRVGAPQRTVVLARSHANNNDDLIRGWVDSVTCGGLAADNQYPVLLTNPGEANLHVSTRNILTTQNIDTVLICGGPSAVPLQHQQDVAEAGVQSVRASGRDRVETAVDVAVRAEYWNAPNPTNKTFLLVPGWDEDFAFGLAASQLSAALNAPMLLVSRDEPTACNSTDRSRATLCYLDDVGTGSVSGLIAVGSTSEISDATFANAARAAGLVEDTTPPAVPSNVAAVDTPEDDGTQVTVSWDVVNDPDGPVQYHVYFRAADADELTKDNSTRVAGGPFDTNTVDVALGPDSEDTEFDFAVTSIDEFGNESDLSAIVSATPTDEAPSTPANAPTLSQVAPDDIKIDWLEAPEADVAGYRIQRAAPGALSGDCATSQIPGTGASYSDLTDANGDVVFVTPKATTTYTDTTVVVGDEYCYRYFVVDSTGNASGTSPEAGPITATSTPPPADPPTGTPTIYAVDWDQAPGIVTDATGPSRTDASSFRVDVSVPAGAFDANEAGLARVKQGSTVRGQRTFTATGAAQIVSVDVASWATGASDVVAVLASASGAEGPPSATWPLTLDSAYLPTPRVTAVNTTVTDPVQFADARIPTVGTPTQPQADRTPRIVVADLDASAGDQFIQLYNNGTQRFQVCVTPTEISNGRYEINSEDLPNQFDAVVTGQNRLVVSVAKASTSCNDPFLNGPSNSSRSGDANTVDYIFNGSAFGILFTQPSPTETDPIGDDFRVVFSGPVSTTSQFTLTKVGSSTPKYTVVNGTTGTSCGNQCDAAPGQADEISLVLTDGDRLSADPGSYVMNIRYTPEGGGAARTESIPFIAGVVHLTSLSSARGTSDTSGPGGTVSTTPTAIVRAAAPTGRYTVEYQSGGAADWQQVAAFNHTQGSETRQSGSDNASVGNVAGKNIRWTYATSSSPDADTSAKQPDGVVPANALAPGDYGVRVRGGGPAFELSGPTATGLDIWYVVNPTDSAGNAGTYVQAPVLAIQSTGTRAAIPNDGVRPGYRVRYFVRDANGNESVTITDGTYNRATAVTPTNGLGNIPGQAESNDRTTIDFNTALAAAPATSPSGNGALVLQANQSVVNPNFGGGNGSSVVIVGSRIEITFGSATTVGGQPVPATVTPPTSLHGGTTWVGIPWLVESADGHTVLLPPDSAPITNAAATW